MFEHKTIQELNDFFVELNRRKEKGVYFYRINGYNEQIHTFIRKYYEAARQTGVIIEGRIPNPDEKNLSYYNEIMGMGFKMEKGFFSASLKKWLPRMNDDQRETVAASFYDALNTMRNSGKNDNMLKNAYIKFMCWLYYKFERIVNRLGENQIPKILYEGTISNYELILISILSNAGCDVILLQYGGDAGYLKLDAASALSYPLNLPDMAAFPEGFSLKGIREDIKNQLNNERLYGILPTVSPCTNAWIEGKGLDDFRVGIANRGNDPKLFYNCFCRISGVEDKLTYLNELYQFQLELKNSGRKVLIIDECIPKPTMEEINGIRRRNYERQDQMLMDLTQNISYTANIELQRLMNKAFIDVMLEEAKRPRMNLNKLTNRGVYLLCWLKRYQTELFSNWKIPDIGCFIYMGGCRDENEAMFLKFLSRLPVDVLILVPNLNTKGVLEDDRLYEVHYTQSLSVKRFPRENGDIQMGTAAYHAERELDEIMYQDSGIYRNQQYDRAVTVTLQTMYEEIAILWDKELKYRPNFSTVDDVVTIPVIFAKVSGVKDRQMPRYWSDIKALVTEDTFVIKDVPYINPTDPNPVKSYTAEFLKNGKVQKNRIKAHSCYQYGVLREDIQDYILDKLQLLIDQKIIKGTYENGTEYTIVATVLNMKKEIVRLIQQFDFTKKNPKLIYINTTETVISLEDSILAAFLNLVGFDIVFFVPTGYQSIEKYFNRKLIEEHQVGDYVYDLHVPDFRTVLPNRHGSGQGQSWWNKIFKRGT